MNQNNISLEKVIKGLSRHGNNNCEYNKETMCPYWGDSHCSSHLCLDALALLKAQEPVAVIPAIKKDNELLHEGNCPVCGMKLDWFYNGDYCGCCGRPVKWK